MFDDMSKLGKIASLVMGLAIAGAWFITANRKHEVVEVLQKIHVEAESKDDARRESCAEGLIESDWCIKRGYSIK